MPTRIASKKPCSGVTTNTNISEEEKAMPEEEKKIMRITCFIIDPSSGQQTEISIDDLILGVRELDERRINQLASEFEEEL